MAAIALNKFRTIRVRATTGVVGIYTCPIGVASIVLLAQVTNVSAGASKGIYKISAWHSRSTESPTDYKFANEVSIPPNDGLNLFSDGRLAMETSDVIKIQADSNDKLEFILSILETAKQ